MAHFALIKKESDVYIVFQVIKVSDDELIVDTVEDEHNGINYLLNEIGIKDIYSEIEIIKQTYKDGSFRHRYAGEGYEWKDDCDAFVRPKPFPSWTFDIATKEYKAPVEYPDDGNLYNWDEENGQWIQFQQLI